MVEKNGRTKWVQHWTTEVRQLLRKMSTEFTHDIRGRYDLRKAYEEVKTEIQEDDPVFRRQAESTLRNRYGFVGLRVKLDDDDEAEFWRQADAAAA